MYCQRCGSLNDDDALFCNECGAPCDDALRNPFAAPAFPSTQEVVHDYLVPNILATILAACCLGVWGVTVGIIGICFSSFALERKRKGDWEEARAKAKTAKILFFVTLGIGLPALICILGIKGLLFFLQSKVSI